MSDEASELSVLELLEEQVDSSSLHFYLNYYCISVL